ncbi:cytochrome c maturation protein CcmE [Sphingomonas sp. LY54]|jgi:cytochrome c-type biogenesis protein CcmE|uniref:cytochrome c maturation protein CcmE n=1 Tax=Sphingomonadales TaxID=204457 RepID=UPI002ADED26F|nr:MULTISPECIES: cytochrome c maturation protein CcmE [Sphingomonadales]MEA1013598.1 cytochrome c maturation protein CcmE [Sphingosinicella sp. LY1275]WRP29036.1 cytochrome c maturation protein CcmE [Sphingomonas sp. LY54]
MKAKNQRLTLLILAIGAVLAAVLLGMSALKDEAAYFYAPADVARKGLPLDRAVRIGGMVSDGSIKRAADGVTIDFLVHDETKAVIPVRFTGIAPDLFKENSGVVAEGRFQPDGTFVATEILAKHDENYMPPQLAGDKHKSETLQ